LPPGHAANITQSYRKFGLAIPLRRRLTTAHGWPTEARVGKPGIPADLRNHAHPKRRGIDAHREFVC